MAGGHLAATLCELMLDTGVQTVRNRVEPSMVIARRFVAPGYDVVANLTAFACATAASMLLAHWIPALLSAMAFACWLGLARRTILARRSLPAPAERNSPHDGLQESWSGSGSSADEFPHRGRSYQT